MSVSIDYTRPTIFYKDEIIQPLTKEDVYNKQILYGKNVIEKHSTRAWYTILLQSVFDPFNMLLIGIATLSLYLDDVKMFIIMLIMVTVSSGIRFYNENKNESKLSALTAMVKKNVTVIRRDSDDIEYDEVIDLRDCVPGDFVKLKAGDLIPAEIQLVKTSNLSVDQSILTGESIPCMKYVLNSNDIIIDYDIERANTVKLKKKKSISLSIKNLLFSCLKSSFGLEFKHLDERVEFDKEVLVQFDKNDLCFMGTSIVSGYCIGVILATGQRTFFGVMSEKICFQKPITAFNKRIKRVSLLFIILMVIILVPIILFKGFDIFKQQEEEDSKQDRWILALQFALSVAIGLTPEMLPMILNANLAKGTISLSNKNCIVKRIESIINLGNMSILCTDKTGTLTENFAKLSNVYDYKRMNCSIGLELAYLNSAYQDAFKNLTDQAIIDAYQEHDFETSQSQFMKINEIPFDFTRRMVSATYESNEHQIRLLTTKGAVKEILDICSFYMDQETPSNNNFLSLDDLFKILSSSNEIDKLIEFDDKKMLNFNYSLRKLTPEVKSQLHKFNDELNQQGYRVLGVAYQIESMSIDKFQSQLVERNLIFVAFLTLVNPPKESVKLALKDLKKNNVSVKVLTGDTVEVCKNVCHQIGLPTEHVLTSKQMNSMIRGPTMEQIILDTVIFSQMSPIQKLEIVKILKTQGQVVGFLGDGINDALSLKEADVGISVDSGTEIAKEAADIILLEKNLDVINDGVIEGRKAFINIVKYISMVVSSNFGNVVSIFVATLWLPFLPMLPIHLLLQNLFYDLSQMTMPWDNVDIEDIRRPQEFKLRNLIIFMLFFGPVSSVFDIATFAYFWFFRGFDNIKNNEDDRALIFQTGWFTIGVLTQTLIVHIARTHKTPIFQSNASLNVYISTLICLIVGLVAPYLPLGQVYDMAHLDLDFYCFLIAVLLSYCVTVQMSKKIYILVFKSWFVYV